MKPFLFFDDGGVLNDNNVRVNQWKPLLADFMVDKYGGDHETWMKANYEAVTLIMDVIEEGMSKNEVMTYKEFEKIENVIWIEHMFSSVGIPFPKKSDYFRISNEANNFVIPKIKSAYPNIVESIQTLYNDDYRIFTASSASSSMLKMFLEGMGILNYFNTLYGSDLIGTMKVSKEYYIRIFEKERLDPKDTIIIDDNVKMLTMAKNLGAMVIQSCVKGSRPEFDLYYSDSKELPFIIEESHF